jgi:hypothetical protein
MLSHSSSSTVADGQMLCCLRRRRKRDHSKHQQLIGLHDLKTGLHQQH